MTNFYNARAFPYLFSLKEQTALPGTKLHTTLWLNPRGGGGDSAYESGGDARRLGYGCKFRSLVSLKVFWAKRREGLV